MASVGDALAIWANISKAVSTLEDLGTNSSALSKEFRAEVDILRERLNFYNKQIRSQRGPVNSSIVAILRKAQLILNEAEPRIKSVQDMQNNIDGCGCCSLICWLYAKLSLALFPEKLEGTLKKVTEEINKISSVMQQEENFAKEMDKNRPIPRTIYTTFYDNSNLYVPIQESHNKTLMAIENLDGPSIVLLHGGVGKGKSTLARYVCAHYGGQERDLFEHVIMVLCGGNRTWVDPLSKQFEILQVLSPKSLDGLSPKQEEPNAHERIEKALRMFLRDNKVLIILDDVSDPDFLYEMWKVAQGCKHVKYFVTSQLGNLCDGSLENESFSIAMRDTNQNESRKILASLVGLADKIIPENLETEADQMIKATGGNPLALACLTSHFARGHHKADKRTWREALQQLDDLLARPEQRKVLGLNHESASLWAAVELCLKILGSAEAKNILLFMYACKGEAIPEEVLSIWYKTTKTSNLFSSAIEELSARELLKSTPSTRIATMMTWSLRPLLKLYMDGHMVDEEETMRRLFGSLLSGSQVGPWSYKQNMQSWVGFSLGGNRIAPESSSVKERPDSEIEAVESDQRRVAKALCAMYFDPTHSNKIVSDMATRARNEVMDLNVSISDLRRKAIEPIIWLLNRPEEDHIWTKAHVQCVRKVFLKYVCEYQLDDQNIYMLLTTTHNTTPTLATVVTLANMFAIEEETLLNRDHMSFLKPLLDTLGSNQGNIQQDLQEAASRTILHISRRATAKDLLIIINTFPILKVLARFLEKPSVGSSANAMNEVPQRLARNAAHTLSNMARNGEEQIHLEILNPQRKLLTSLVGALGKDDDPALQEMAATALLNLAYNDKESIRVRILKENGALAGLARNLSRHGNPSLQSTAAWALANLINPLLNSETMMCVASEDGVIPGLVMGLFRDENPVFQKHAARALAGLAVRGDSICASIVREDGAIQGFVRALSNDNNPGFQKTAALALGNLAGGGEPIHNGILREEGALQALVRALSNDNNPDFQQNAAWALSNLAIGGESIRDSIVREDRALQGLVRALSNDNNPGFQKNAALALASLATGGESICNSILREDKALQGLVRALSNDNNPDFQKNAAWALGNLATGGESICDSIVREDRALQGLVRALSNDNNPGFQQNAAMALGNLAIGGESIRDSNVREDTALQGLVRTLYNDNNLGFQNYAAWELDILASAGEPIRNCIVREEGALRGLVRALSSDNNPLFQMNAAWALASLARGGEPIRNCIVREDGALQGLVRGLSNDNNPHFQRNAARALASLAGGGEPFHDSILREDGALQGLVRALSNDNNPAFQQNAAWALSNLAIGGESICDSIVREDRALQDLVRALSNGNSPKFQQNAASALASLARGGEPIRNRIVREDGALQGLVRGLSNDNNPGFQENVAEALSSLAEGGESICDSIMTEDRALQGLVRALSSDNNPRFQESAASALANLATGGESVCNSIVRQDRALQGLVRALSNDNNPDFQQNAAWALSNLAIGGESIRDSIVREDRALQGLVRALSNDNNPGFQQNAAAALGNLATGGEAIRTSIVREDRALQGLVRALSNDNNPGFQENAAEALSNLAEGEDSTRFHVLHESGALAGLVTSLSKHDHSCLRRIALMALGNLARGPDSYISQIANTDEALPALVGCLSEEGDQEMQEYAARALKFLASTEDYEIKCRIRREDGLLKSLVKAASQQNTNLLRMNAEEALENLELPNQPYESRACQSSFSFDPKGKRPMDQLGP